MLSSQKLIAKVYEIAAEITKIRMVLTKTHYTVVNAEKKEEALWMAEYNACSYASQSH